jgi:hypothetical protein
LSRRRFVSDCDGRRRAKEEEKRREEKRREEKRKMEERSAAAL